MIRCVPTTVDYIQRFDPQPYQKEAWEEARDLLTEDILANTRTLVDRDMPIAILGTIHRWSNHWQGYTIYSQQMIDHPMGYIRAMRRAIASLFEEMTMDRLEITTPCDHPKASRLAEFLGFEREGLVRRYGRDGGDHELFAKVREA